MIVRYKRSPSLKIYFFDKNAPWKGNTLRGEEIICGEVRSQPPAVLQN